MQGKQILSPAFKEQFLKQEQPKLKDVIEYSKREDEEDGDK